MQPIPVSDAVTQRAVSAVQEAFAENTVARAAQYARRSTTWSGPSLNVAGTPLWYLSAGRCMTIWLANGSGCGVAPFIGAPSAARAPTARHTPAVLHMLNNLGLCPIAYSVARDRRPDRS